MEILHTARLRRMVSKMNFGVSELVSRKVLRIIRVVLAVIIFYSVIMRTVHSWSNDIHPILYFTIQSNILCGLYWLWCAVFPERRNAKFTLVVTTYITITGLVFILLLEDGIIEQIYTRLGQHEITDITHYYAMIVSIITHYMIPFLAIIDFIVFTDMREIKTNKKVMLYPIGYAVFALIYTMFSSKFIYPFYNPSVVGGLGYVVLITLIIFALVFVIQKVLYWINCRTQARIEKYYASLFNTIR